MSLLLVPSGIVVLEKNASVRSTQFRSAPHRAPAAWAAKNYRDGFKKDWFLPSSDELDELFTQRAAVGGFATDASSSFYWVVASPNVRGEQFGHGVGHVLRR
jgi:hypothetical protein